MNHCEGLVSCEDSDCHRSRLQLEFAQLSVWCLRNRIDLSSALCTMTTLADLELIANISSAYDTLKSRVVVALRTQIGDAVQLE